MFLPNPDVDPTNFRHRRRNLTEADVTMLANVLSKTCSCCGFRPTQEQVARRYGITRSTVAKIAVGEHYHQLKSLDTGSGYDI
jgi:acetyl-CoA acetyltransferase